MTSPVCWPTCECLHDVSSSVIVPDWPAPARVGALVTTRKGGVSAAPWDSFNLGLHVGDSRHCVEENRRRLQLHLPAEPVWLNQVHGIDVIDASVSGDRSSADAAYSVEPGVVCAVLTADCLPVLLCDSNARCVAAVHAGWRGLLNGVVEAAAAAIRRHAHGEILAWLGPAIGPEVFEVGPEIRDAFIAHEPIAGETFRPGIGDRWFCDIYRLARLRLTLLGVTRIFGGEFCTVTDKERFFSYRRDKVSGRMATCIWLNRE